MTCVICRREVKPRERNRAFPFCSERCKNVDLGRWFSEVYRIPVEDDGERERTGGEGEDA